MTQDRMITAITVTNGEKSDGKYLDDLVTKTEESGLKVKELIADKVYSSRDNLEYISKKEIKAITPLNEINYKWKQGKQRFYICQRCRCCVIQGGAVKFQETAYFKAHMKECYKIEAKNGELKNNHGLRTNRYRGLFGMLIQSYFTVYVANRKRIARIMH